MAFWTDFGAGKRDPKRNFRFRVVFDGFEDSASWYAKKCSKPSFAITDSKHAFLNHNFYYPGKVEWNPVTVTLVDPVEPDAMSQLLAIIEGSGYNLPQAGTNQGLNTWTTFTKSSMNQALGGSALTVRIEQLDGTGAAIETWDLNQAFIKDVKFSELSYDSEDLSEITLEIRYDWASLTAGTAGSAKAISTTKLDGNTETVAKATKEFFKP